MNRSHSHRLVWLLGIALLLSVSCSSIPTHSSVETTLYFGLGKPDGSVVSEQEWQHFVDTEVSPQFPNGFTIVDARGHWKGASGTTHREPSRILTIIRNNSVVEDRKIAAIISAYKKAASQESVLRTDHAVSTDL